MSCPTEHSCPHIRGFVHLYRSLWVGLEMSIPSIGSPCATFIAGTHFVYSIKL